MPKILVCEDDPLFLEFYQSILADAGHAVLAVENGKAGLERLAKERFDLVLTDLVMPDTDGLELIRSMRERHAAVPVIAISEGLPGYLGPLLRAAGHMGATQVLQKPVRRSALLTAVGELLSGQQLASEPAQG